MHGLVVERVKVWMSLQCVGTKVLDIFICCRLDLEGGETGGGDRSERCAGDS